MEVASSAKTLVPTYLQTHSPQEKHEISRFSLAYPQHTPPRRRRVNMYSSTHWTPTLERHESTSHPGRLNSSSNNCSTYGYLLVSFLNNAVSKWRYKVTVQWTLSDKNIWSLFVSKAHNRTFNPVFSISSWRQGKVSLWHMRVSYGYTTYSHPVRTSVCFKSH
jgi:hypothetical protein